MTTATRAFSLALATGAVIGQAPTHVPADAFDVPEGLEWGWSRDADRARADARAGLRGHLRWGEDGPGVAMDLSALARLRLGLLKARSKPFRGTAR